MRHTSLYKQYPIEIKHKSIHNLKFSSDYIKSKKETGENNFYYIFYSNISKISFQHVINIKLLMSYFMAFHTKSQDLGCTLY